MPARRFRTPFHVILVALILVTAGAWAWTRHKSWFIGYPKGPAQWRSLQDGLEYRRIDHAGMTFHATRFDLQRYELRVADARRSDRRAEFVDGLLKELDGVVAVNGTFFELETDWSPTGWLVDRGKELSADPNRHWYVTLLLDGTDGLRPKLLDHGVLPPPIASIPFAIQVGPRNVRSGVALPGSWYEAERTAACIVTPTTMILLATEGAPVGYNYLANVMARTNAEGGLGCREGMMFDGGPSTQMAIRTPALNVDVRGGWPVPNAVVVVPRGH